ncbi:LysR family transcriptional regulator [Pectobacterium peruviense]|uniref:LysR family transcriptional regulator n=2 Tax=Pectobacterium peruviense TaxID=2066479 RepID=A0ABX4SF98_9GAMM|nr:LysR family transcriptional regulator [Pectobacterium peruviense]PKX81671.1 LysR family transcriptional regulator [Pectobacterium peruviense]PKX88145.1 LysR family transcriptional regulator [Pectobacterium peruviense]
MDKLGSIGIFVRVAERLGFSSVSRELGVSPSSVGKAVARLEARLGVRLFHRSTRTLALTAEGEKFLERCRRILSEVEAAELEMTQASETPYGKLRVSLPRHSSLFEPVIAEFMRRYPAVELDLDFSDRLVDVIGDGFDATIRTGTLADSGLKRRQLGSFRRVLVGAPEYFEVHGLPQHPVDLQRHTCLHYRFPSSGRLEQWPLPATTDENAYDLPLSLVCNSIEMRIHLARQDQGIACLPDFSVAKYLRDGRLQTILDDFTHNSSPMWILWPASRDLSPKLRAFIDCLSEKTFS